MEIPCGGCIGCRLDRAAEWQARLVHESKLHPVNSFITLTYSPECLPRDGSLVKKHFQDFMKRLRKSHGGTIRYFVCGEYGDRDNRPHYHAIIFGHDWADKRHCSTGSRGDKLYKSAVLDRQWGLGQCWIGNVSADSCGYVARYIMKKVTGDQAKEHYERVNLNTGEIVQLLPEYINMSTKPSIGHDFYQRFKNEILDQDSVLLKGKKRKVPRAYDRLTEKEDPFLLEHIKFQRQKSAYLRRADNTDERLKVREEVKKATIKTLSRNL